MVVGITGIFCSGKSLATGLFGERGYAVVDVDRTGYEALEVRKEQVVGAFGAGVLDPAGSVDRRRLGRIVFADPDRRRTLESIVHPWMIRRVKELLAGRERAVIDAALLIEMCLFPLCDVVIGVDVEERTALERAMERDRLSREEALARIGAQKPLKEKSHFVDMIIDNNGEVAAFREKVLVVIERLEQKA